MKHIIKKVGEKSWLSEAGFGFSGIRAQALVFDTREEAIKRIDQESSPRSAHLMAEPLEQGEDA